MDGDSRRRRLYESAHGQRVRRSLKKHQEVRPYFEEIFVMDNQGANVCMSDKTSDYWQGDEDKFTESYKGGSGAVHLSDVKFDESFPSYTVQVSVPVKDAERQ